MWTGEQFGSAVKPEEQSVACTVVVPYCYPEGTQAASAIVLPARNPQRLSRGFCENLQISVFSKVANAASDLAILSQDN